MMKAFLQLIKNSRFTRGKTEDSLEIGNFRKWAEEEAEEEAK